MKRKTLLGGFYLFCILYFITSCVSVNSPYSNITFEKAKKVQPQVTTRDDIRNIFGIPNKENNLSEMPEYEDDGDLWGYSNDSDTKSRKLTFYFKKNSPFVSSVSWHIDEGEPQADFEMVKTLMQDKYKELNLQEREKSWQSTHPATDVIYFEDPKQGVVIFLQKSNKKVSAITWSDPKVYAEMSAKLNRPLSCHHGTCVSIEESIKNRTLTSPLKKQ